VATKQRRGCSKCRIWQTHGNESWIVETYQTSEIKKLRLKPGNGKEVKEGEYKTMIKYRSNDGDW
jgi:hypothetical protein